MATIKEQALAFMEKCEELKNCKFIMATSRIGDILKCIVNNPEIYNLFKTVTADFNYVAAKKQYLISYNDGVLEHNYVQLPDTIGERLAFIFCLLVEFDQNTLNFNEFLQKYYSQDGSFFGSFHSFCDSVIDSLQKMVAEIYTEELQEQDAAPIAQQAPNADYASMFSVIEMLIAQEREFLAQNITGDDLEDGTTILDELVVALRSCNKNCVNALLIGYNYFVLYHNCVSPVLAEFLQTVAQAEALL